MSQEVGKTDETEWEDEQIGRENWLKSHDKIKKWMSFPTDFLSSSWCFMSFGCPFLHCIIRFSSVFLTKVFVVPFIFISFSHLPVIFSQVTRFYAFSLTTWSFYHRRSSFLPIHSLIFSWDFNQYSLPICSSSHSVSSDFPTSWLISSLDFICFLHFFLWSVDFILFPSYCNVWCIIFI